MSDSSPHGSLRDHAITLAIAAVFIGLISVAAGSIGDGGPVLPMVVMEAVGVLLILLTVAVTIWGLQGGMPRVR